LYNPQTRQSSLYSATSKGGPIYPPQIGEFYAQDTLNGKSVLVRFIWLATNTNSPHFEPSVSEDGGKTWEVTWIDTKLA
jgi:hypothetical protein